MTEHHVKDSERRESFIGVVFFIGLALGILLGFGIDALTAESKHPPAAKCASCVECKPQEVHVTSDVNLHVLGDVKVYGEITGEIPIRTTCGRCDPHDKPYWPPKPEPIRSPVPIKPVLPPLKGCKPEHCPQQMGINGACCE